MTDLEYVYVHPLYKNRKDHGKMFLARIMVYADLLMLIKLDHLIDIPRNERKSALKKIMSEK